MTESNCVILTGQYELPFSPSMDPSFYGETDGR